MRVSPCPVCGSSKSKPCIIYENDRIYCHDTACTLNEKSLTVEEFMNLIEGNGSSPEKKAKPVIRKPVNKQILEDAVNFLHSTLLPKKDTLLNNRPLRYQIIDRGHSITSLKAFKVGYFSDSKMLLSHLMQNHEFEAITQSGFFDEKGKCFVPFDSYTYPIYIDGQIRNIKFKSQNGGGYIKKDFVGDDFPLWLNSDVLKDYEDVFLVEGENDLLSMWDNGYMNTIATLGGIKSKQVEYLKNLSHRKILVLAFDNDEAGNACISKTTRLLEKYHDIELVQYDGKDPDECFNQHNGEIYFQKPKLYIRNYVTVTSPSGKTYKEYVKDITDEMAMPLADFYSFENVEGKKILYSEDSNREVSKPDPLWVQLRNHDYIMDFMPGGLSEGKYLEYLKEHSKTFNRFSLLPEITPDRKTRYLSKKLKGSKTGEFRKLVELFTLESEKDQYRLAAGFLSGFLGRKFDGDKPLFSLMANSPSSGKTTVVRKGVNILQDEYPISFNGVKEDEEAIGSHLGMANKFAIYDNIEFPTYKQCTHIEKVLTDKNIKSWIMHITHGFVPNNKTYFATFNNDQSLVRDMLERALVIRMRDAKDITDKERHMINTGLDLAYHNRHGILQDIYGHLEEVDWGVSVAYKPHQKFTYWSAEMAKVLKVFWPEIEVFDFSLSKEDKKIDTDMETLLEMLEEILIGSDDEFVPNSVVHEKFRDHFGYNHRYAGNVVAMNKKLKGMTKNLDGFEMNMGKKSGKRGWHITRFVPLFPIKTEEQVLKPEPVERKEGSFDAEAATKKINEVLSRN